MAYEKQTWVDGVTPLDAEHLNHMEQGISEANGNSGEDGGYYTPEVTQPDVDTMEVSFTPSKATMPGVASKKVTLPAGPTGATGPEGPQGIQGAAGPAGANGKSAYAYAVESGYTGTEAEFAAKLAAEKVANPYALTFTGAATGSYDGSQPLTVEIPDLGSLPIGNADWEKATINIEEQVFKVSVSSDDKGNLINASEFIAFAHLDCIHSNGSEVTGSIYILINDVNVGESIANKGIGANKYSVFYYNAKTGVMAWVTSTNAANTSMTSYVRVSSYPSKTPINKIDISTGYSDWLMNPGSEIVLFVR